MEANSRERDRQERSATGRVPAKHYLAGGGHVALGVESTVVDAFDPTVLADHVGDAPGQAQHGQAHAVRAEDLSPGVADERIRQLQGGPEAVGRSLVVLADPDDFGPCLRDVRESS